MQERYLSPPLSVYELTVAIKQHLESRFTTVHVRGEVSNVKEQSSGHIYFTLKDAQSQISAVLFRGNTRLLSRPLQNGDQIVVHGELSLYALRGNYQIIVREVEYAGVGQLLAQLHHRKQLLEAKGWFDPARKKTLPQVPKTIGVVTSPTGSVIQDILHVLERRFAGFHLVLFPVKVQGEGAAEEIAKAIHLFNTYKMADVLIVGRGGGSLEDLWAFNELLVAEAIFRSEIPIVSAVGHETDFSIADFVADKRAPTPSAAAEIIIAEKASQLRFLSQTWASLRNTLQLMLSQQRTKWERFATHPLMANSYALLAPYIQRIDTVQAELDQITLHYIKEKQIRLQALQTGYQAFLNQPYTSILREKLAVLTKSIDIAISQLLMRKQESFKTLCHHLQAIHPNALLQKGYSILFRENEHSVIVSTHDVVAGERLSILLRDGRLSVTVASQISPSPLDVKE